jgi:hypothetical protein
METSYRSMLISCNVDCSAMPSNIQDLVMEVKQRQIEVLHLLFLKENLIIV